MIQFAKDYILLYFEGTLVALGVATLSMVLSVAIGLVGALGRMSGNRPVRSVTSGYVAFFRGIPPWYCFMWSILGCRAGRKNSGFALSRISSPP